MAGMIDQLKDFLTQKVCIPTFIILLIILVFINYSQYNVSSQLSDKYDNLKWYETKNYQNMQPY